MVSKTFISVINVLFNFCVSVNMPIDVNAFVFLHFVEVRHSPCATTVLIASVFGECCLSVWPTIGAVTAVWQDAILDILHTESNIWCAWIVVRHTSANRGVLIYRRFGIRNIVRHTQCRTPLRSTLPII